MNEYRNIYQIARESSGLTQEKSSELLDISVDSLRAYEGGKRVPPDHVVIKMIEIYDTQYLAYQHLKTSAEVGQRYLPTINITQLPTAILRLQKEVKDFLKCEDSLIEIGSDGHVDDNEALQYKNVMKELDEVVEAIMALKFSKED
ncbi:MULTISPECIES: helix-turn-helix domain-containing protein [Clostridium]|uniref:XRE family transcriptional regulator n=1 Tax=Clostridium cadaveris TaxID=1529 RepID=A0A316MAY7_9CLOT|nr:helix-turn-helix transcriptional regulator [Clostridium cadaveris]MDU4952949.1 helix-turn-helix transcriptional regulator [Clostridium sp.]PWL55444.1 MAG: XRE family transcriptional regulator [Clostridium cadaveris]